MIVYFDRNVFADLCELRRDFTKTDLELVQRAVDRKVIIIPLSSTLLDETVKVYENNPNDYERHMRIVSGLIDRSLTLLPQFEILDNDCFSYASGLPYRTPFTGTPRYFLDLLDLSTDALELSHLSKTLSREVRESTEQLNRRLQSAEIVDDQRIAVRDLEFKEFWEINADHVVEVVLATQLPTVKKLCLERGIHPMLRIKSIRIFSIYYSWIVYSSWYGDQGNPRNIKKGDVNDLFHAINSSSAQIFVCQERKEKVGSLSYILTQVSTPEYRVLNLYEFLDWLRSKPGL